MRKIKLIPLFIAMISLLTISSCKKEQETYWQAIGTLVTVNSATSITFVDDNGTIIKLVDSPFVMSSEYEGKRASITFIRTDEVVTDNDKIMNGKLVYMDFITTESPILLSQFENEEALKKEVGEQYITPVSGWFGGNYLNLVYRAGFSNLNEKRKVSLVIDTEKSTDTEIVAGIYYKADDAPKDYYFNNFAEGLIAIDMRNYVYDNNKVVTFTISYIDAEMRGKDVFVIKSNNSKTIPQSSVSSEKINFTQK